MAQREPTQNASWPPLPACVSKLTQAGHRCQLASASPCGDKCWEQPTRPSVERQAPQERQARGGCVGSGEAARGGHAKLLTARCGVAGPAVARRSGKQGGVCVGGRACLCLRRMRRLVARPRVGGPQLILHLVSSGPRVFRPPPSLAAAAGGATVI